MSNTAEDKYLTVRVTPELHAQLAELADREDRTIAAEIRRALQAHIDATHAARSA